MSDDNPYAASQAPPEGKPPVPRRGYLLAGIAGIGAFLGSGTLMLLFFDALAVLTDWYGLPVPERKTARYAILTCCVVLATLIGIMTARRMFRQWTKSV